MLERERNRLARFGGLPADRRAELTELTAQGMHLVDKVDHRLDRLVIEAHLVDQLGEQAGARHLDRLEGPSLALRARPPPAALHPTPASGRGEPARRARE